MTALGATVATARPIPADRSTSLHRWNVALAFLHGVQFLAMLALSLTQSPMATAPVVSSYLTFDPATSRLIRRSAPCSMFPSVRWSRRSSR